MSDYKLFPEDDNYQTERDNGLKLLSKGHVLGSLNSFFPKLNLVPNSKGINLQKIALQNTPMVEDNFKPTLNKNFSLFSDVNEDTRNIFNLEKYQNFIKNDSSFSLSSINNKKKTTMIFEKEKSELLLSIEYFRNNYKTSLNDVNVINLSKTNTVKKKKASTSKRKRIYRKLNYCKLDSNSIFNEQNYIKTLSSNNIENVVKNVPTFLNENITVTSSLETNIHLLKPNYTYSSVVKNSLKPNANKLLSSTFSTAAKESSMLITSSSSSSSLPSSLSSLLSWSISSLSSEFNSIQDKEFLKNVKTKTSEKTVPNSKQSLKPKIKYDFNILEERIIRDINNILKDNDDETDCNFFTVKDIKVDKDQNNQWELLNNDYNDCTNYYQPQYFTRPLCTNTHTDSKDYMSTCPYSENGNKLATLFRVNDDSKDEIFCAGDVANKMKVNQDINKNNNELFNLIDDHHQTKTSHLPSMVTLVNVFKQMPYDDVHKNVLRPIDNNIYLTDQSKLLLSANDIKIKKDLNTTNTKYHSVQQNFTSNNDDDLLF